MPPRLSPKLLYAIRPLKASTFSSSISPCLRSLPHHPPLTKSTLRPASQGGPRRPQYNRFGNAEAFYYIWRTNPNVRFGVTVLGFGVGGFVYYNIEEVPISGRRRFNCVSSAQEQAMAESEYQTITRQYKNQILPPDHPSSKMVNRVLGRLIPAAGLEGQKWEVKVIDSPEPNAFVLPGNKVFVFSGILPICAGEDGLAAVLGHEMAHNVAHHIGEKISHYAFLIPIALLLATYFDISGNLSQTILELALALPHSRKMESEADYIGLLMMAQACYNPSAAVGLWERMAQAEKFSLPSILSTHPASEKRMTVIEQWLPQAQQKRAESQCGTTTRYMDDFATTFSHEDEGFW